MGMSPEIQDLASFFFFSFFLWSTHWNKFTLFWVILWRMRFSTDSSTLFCVCFFTDWIGEARKSWRLWKCKGEISLPVVSKGFKASLFFFFFPSFLKVCNCLAWWEEGYPARYHVPVDSQIPWAFVVVVTPDWCCAWRISCVKFI